MALADADAVLALARSARLTLATAESLTGGALCAELVAVPGASESVRGGVIAYDVAMKHRLLDVDASMLEDPGPVSQEVAQAMATGARRALDADVAVATTGVAGPDPHGGHAAGTVWVAVDCGGVRTARLLHLSGDRADVVSGTVRSALDLARNALEARAAGS
ncbi:CinA family protein [Demequina aestuarii]|uniref:CinA family protein n=1 Tax=Demequina aestuarii TaxID=327095 RepID=UPI000785D583|nr:nicotinamide-nucleotide amidohydrolase family protein [Demequina aestuarii]